MFTAMCLGLVSSMELISFFPNSLSCHSLKPSIALAVQEKCNVFTQFSLACNQQATQQAVVSRGIIALQVADASSLNSAMLVKGYTSQSHFPGLWSISLLSSSSIRWWSGGGCGRAGTSLCRLTTIFIVSQMVPITPGLGLGGPSGLFKTAMGMDIHTRRDLTSIKHQPELLHRFFQIFLLDIST